MPYSDFTLRRVKQDFNLTILEQPTFLDNPQSIEPSAFLASFLEKYLPLALEDVLKVLCLVAKHYRSP